MFSVQGLTKSFGKEQVLGPVNHIFKEGKTTAIIGPSGSGKSTFLRCLNGLEKATTGLITYKDILLDDTHLHTIRQEVGMVFQNFNLFSNKTVLANVAYALRVVKQWPKEKANQHALEMLELVGLKEKAPVYPKTLSGGQKQRVAIARTLAMSPEVFLFDEPTSALDPEMVGEVLDVMRTITQKGFTNIMVTHEMGFAREVADEIIFMHQGLIREVNETKTFFASPQTIEAQAFLAKIL